MQSTPLTLLTGHFKEMRSRSNNLSVGIKKVEIGYKGLVSKDPYLSSKCSLPGLLTRRRAEVAHGFHETNCGSLTFSNKRKVREFGGLVGYCRFWIPG